MPSGSSTFKPISASRSLSAAPPGSLNASYATNLSASDISIGSSLRDAMRDDRPAYSNRSELNKLVENLRTKGRIMGTPTSDPLSGGRAPQQASNIKLPDRPCPSPSDSTRVRPTSQPSRVVSRPIVSTATPNGVQASRGRRSASAEEEEFEQFERSIEAGCDPDDLLTPLRQAPRSSAAPESRPSTAKRHSTGRASVGNGAPVRGYMTKMTKEQEETAEFEELEAELQLASARERQRKAQVATHAAPKAPSGAPAASTASTSARSAAQNATQRSISTPAPRTQLIFEPSPSSAGGAPDDPPAAHDEKGPGAAAPAVPEIAPLAAPKPSRPPTLTASYGGKDDAQVRQASPAPRISLHSGYTSFANISQSKVDDAPGDARSASPSGTSGRDGIIRIPKNIVLRSSTSSVTSPQRTTAFSARRHGPPSSTPTDASSAPKHESIVFTRREKPQEQHDTPGDDAPATTHIRAPEPIAHAARKEPVVVNAATSGTGRSVSAGRLRDQAATPPPGQLPRSSPKARRVAPVRRLVPSGRITPPVQFTADVPPGSVPPAPERPGSGDDRGEGTAPERPVPKQRSTAFSAASRRSGSPPHAPVASAASSPSTYFSSRSAPTPKPNDSRRSLSPKIRPADASPKSRGTAPQRVPGRVSPQPASDHAEPVLRKSASLIHSPLRSLHHATPPRTVASPMSGASSSARRKTPDPPPVLGGATRLPSRKSVSPPPASAAGGALAFRSARLSGDPKVDTHVAISPPPRTLDISSRGSMEPPARSAVSNDSVGRDSVVLLSPPQSDLSPEGNRQDDDVAYLDHIERLVHTLQTHPGSVNDNEHIRFLVSEAAGAGGADASAFDKLCNIILPGLRQQAERLDLTERQKSELSQQLSALRECLLLTTIDTKSNASTDEGNWLLSNESFQRIGSGTGSFKDAASGSTMSGRTPRASRSASDGVKTPSGSRSGRVASAQRMPTAQLTKSLELKIESQDRKLQRQSRQVKNLQQENNELALRLKSLSKESRCRSPTQPSGVAAQLYSAGHRRSHTPKFNSLMDSTSSVQHAPISRPRTPASDDRRSKVSTPSAAGEKTTPRVQQLSSRVNTPGAYVSHSSTPGDLGYVRPAKSPTRHMYQSNRR